MKRIQSKTEAEFVWSSGRLVRSRVLREKGFWEKSGKTFSQGTLTPTMPVPSKVASLAKKFQKLLGWKELKIVFIASSRELGRLRQNSSMWYFQASHEELVSSFCLSNDRTDVVPALQQWKKELEDFLSLPLIKKSFEAKELVFTPATLGCLIHESVGHALEEEAGEFYLKNLNSRFRVWDEAGDPTQVGHTPWDDCGRRIPSRLLHDGPRSKSFNFFQSAGNMRAVDYRWHPITRQRCLRVEAVEETVAPQNNFLRLDEAQLGSWYPGTGLSEISTSRAVYVDSKGRRFRVPPLLLSFRAELLSELNPFGEARLYEPAGGCHKEQQRSLPVSFVAPSARVKFSRIKKNFRIEVLGSC